MHYYQYDDWYNEWDAHSICKCNTDDEYYNDWNYGYDDYDDQ